MKTWKQMSEDNRKTICSCISHNKKSIEISKIINYNPRAISKEVKRNRKPVDYSDQAESKCPKLNRWPYVCTNCKYRYKDYSFVKFIYDSKIAQEKSVNDIIRMYKKCNIKMHNITLLNTPIKSLDGNTPKDAFITVYSEDLYNKIFDIVNDER